ncbi:hypothetical protein [Actinoallomurus sp. NPDC050550]|uniref:hypothetical protein n=1 Tax=Actinoallomurus sp. NPDC050550 TaxID=3154937 RepID=UPI0033F7D5B1
MTTPDQQTPDTGEEPAYPNRRVAIAAAIGGLILTIGLALTLKGDGTGHHDTPTTTVTLTPTYTRQIPLASPTTTTPATPIKPVIRWHGTVTVNGPSAYRDLDSIPPRTDQRDADINGDWLETTLSAASTNVQIALLQTGGTLPGFDQCRQTAFANGSDHTEELQTGDVLCVLTSQGRIARLKTIRAEQTFSDPILKFSVTIWDPPAP